MKEIIKMKIKKKINTIGTIGKIISIVAIVLMFCAGVAVTSSAVAIAALPSDAVSANVSADVDVAFSDVIFGALKEKTVEKINADPQTVHDAFSGIATVTAEGTDDATVIHVHSDQFLIRSGDAIPFLLLALVDIAGIIVCLFFFKSLMSEFRQCDSPFSDGVVRKMRNFAISLLPAAVASSVSDTIFTYYFSVNHSLSMSLNLAPVVAALVIFVLVMIFNYGVALQKESDEIF